MRYPTDAKLLWERGREELCDDVRVEQQTFISSRKIAILSLALSFGGITGLPEFGFFFIIRN